MSLGKLVCGETATSCVANTTLDHLGHSIDRFATKALCYLNSPFSDEAESFGAFSARVTLENACAALVGRLDPFRMMYLSEFQAQGGYEYGKPVKSGFKWTGDVLTDEKAARELWNIEHDITKVSRALFSAHVDHLYWRPAIEASLDFLAGKNLSALSDLRALDPEKLISESRGRCAALYSTLSKGVHWDFFVSSFVMDEGTLKDAIRDCLAHLSRLSFISHFVETAYRRLEPEAAFATYTAFRGSFE